MPGTNGTDEGVLRAWLDREEAEWDRAFQLNLADTVDHLQVVCFIDARDTLLTDGKTPEEAGVETLRLYEAGIVDIFRFTRAAGVLADDGGWARLKLAYRKSAIDDGATEAVRQALDDALYQVELSPRGDPARYRSWSRALMLFLYYHAAGAAAERASYPGREASDEKKYGWAYDCLKEIEDHAAFHITLAGYLYEPGVFPVVEAVIDHPVDEILTLETEMIQLNRFDLIMNTGLRWLVGAVERD